MAEIILTIPTEHVPRVVHALCKAYGKDPENAANAKEAVIGFIRATVRNVESAEAERSALDVLTEPDTEGIVT